MSELLDLEYQLAIYKAYHLHPKNVVIHLFFIPMIFYTAAVMLGAVQVGSFTAADIGSFGYGIYYTLLHAKVGLTADAILVSIIATVHYFYDNFSRSQILYPALVLHITGWAFQFWGHYYYEKKRPALIDNLAQPLVLAPYFVLWELVFAFGFEKDLKTKMEKRAKQLRPPDKPKQ
ncbi:hypothetical protein OGAPHI_004879 [Ogataea philodendri]|uniref:DUF962 domain protein n=1 Tax=Ogataea philodendri TaxID=1378263 RepID=A0A9P8P327_9ASCO|nr:uncharacterized protein OGAPHI_004879 [Ogataea philodendri]KAH3664165.1 hypothetical protein OGAPHI_004879 [Ogataea philodendri]